MSPVQNFTEVKICVDQLVQGQDKEYLDEFVCKICLVHVVGSGPQLTKCSHLFCGDCLQEWFSKHPSTQTWAQRAKTKGAIPCPVCKTMLHKESDVYPVAQHGDAESLQLWRMIHGLQIKCNAKHATCGGSCAWEGEYGSYQNHLLSGTCGKVELGPKAASYEESIKEGPCILEESKKGSQYSSTCSDVSTDNVLEELHTDSITDGSGIDESECVECLDSPTNSHVPIEDNLTSPLQELLPDSAIEPHGDVERGLTSLIQDLMNMNTNESGSAPHLPKQATFPDLAAEQHADTCADQPILMLPPGLEDFSEVPAEIPVQVQRAAIAPPVASKASKGGKNKKKNQPEPKDTLTPSSQNAGKQLTPEQLQAYQWQVAQYQMAYAQQYQMAIQRSANAAGGAATAYAQQYQMAIQAARMQQVAQYYQQAQQATGMR